MLKFPHSIVVFLLALTATLIVLLFAICLSSPDFKRPQIPSAFQPLELEGLSKKSFNLDVAITRGNHTYIPIHRDGGPAEFAEKILELVESFENSHPELSISEFQIEKSQTSPGLSYYIYGIWLHHKPK